MTQEHTPNLQPTLAQCKVALETLTCETNEQFVAVDAIQEIAAQLLEALIKATDQLEKAVGGDRIDTDIVNQLLDRTVITRASLHQTGKLDD